MAPFFRRTLFAVMAFELALAGFVFVNWGGGTEGLQHGARYSARLSFLWFLPIFLARPLAVLAPMRATLALSRQTRALGLSFGLAHFCHFAWLVAFSAAAGETPSPATLFAGGGAYIALSLMIVTSTNWARRALGPTWKWLHRFGLYYLWFIFAISYFGRTQEQPGFGWLFGIAVGALLIRLVALGVGARRRPS